VTKTATDIKPGNVSTYVCADILKQRLEKDMSSIEQIFTKNNFIVRDKLPDISISEIENAIGFLLPADYIDFLLKFKQFEGPLGPEYCQLWNIENLISTNNDYEILNYMEKTIGIGTNLGGELIAIEKVENNQYRLILTPFNTLSKDDNLTIGDSFTDFLMRLDNGKEWFEN
jgi:hypothetical protein